MDAEIAVALISAAVALTSLAWNARTNRRQRDSEKELARLKEELQEHREIRSEQRKKRELADQVLSKYRDPLLLAAYALQSRLYNIVHQRFLQTFYTRDSLDQESYARDNTLYVVAQFLGWMEIIRQEIQFLDLGAEIPNRQLASLLEGVYTTFSTDTLASPFRLFAGHQRAIGEIMILERQDAHTIRRECIGYARFVKSLQNPDFSRWFETLRRDIDALAFDGSYERLKRMQNQLIDVIDFLDKERIRIATNRDKI
jgi:hypothetical protein